MLKRSFLLNLLLIVLISIGLLYAFFYSLNWLTNHGEETKVPKLQGKKMEVAVKELKKMGFRIQIDSTYQSYKDPLEVLFQEPEAGMTVKVGRTIFLTVNRQTPPSIAMPNLVNMSFRNALLTMHSYNLEMGDTTYRPDVAAGAILEQWVKGKQITPGTMIPFGTQIDLVVGEGLSTTMDVPNLIGMQWGVVREMLDSLLITTNVIWDGVITDSSSAVIYMQQPEAINELDFKNSINEGDIIDLHIMQHPSQELLDKHQPGSMQLTGEAGVDSNAPPIETATSAASFKKEPTDSHKKRHVLPGMTLNPNVKAKPDDKNKKDKNNKLNSSDVNKIKKKAKPKTTDNAAPAKKDNNISDEFN